MKLIWTRPRQHEVRPPNSPALQLLTDAGIRHVACIEQLKQMHYHVGCSVGKSSGPILECLGFLNGASWAMADEGSTAIVVT